MRSVVVVFPASMCAEIPMFRYRSIGVARATVTDRSYREPNWPSWLLALPAVVREGLVGLRHTMRVLALADGGATVFRSIHQFVSEPKRHGLLAAVASSLDDPAHGQCLAAGRANFNRDLVGGTTHTARLHFDNRFDVVQRNGQHVD